MTGQRFASLLALSNTGERTRSNDLKWRFRCDCGNEFVANGYYARSGKIVSCPSCAAERTRQASVKHGKSNTREFGIWIGMHTRCYNAKAKSFTDYGGRGIDICERWKNSFDNFLSDMGAAPSKEHSIDRRDNDGNYEPGNCYWATRAEQANNKRNSIRISIDGVTRTISQWAAISGLAYETIYQRHCKSNSVDQHQLLKAKRAGAITFKGCTDTYHGWSKKTGIKPSTIAMRIKAYGWSVEKSLTQGATL